MPPPRIDPATTALVLIDLQTRIVGLPTAPYSGQQVVTNAVRLRDAFRAAGAAVFVVQVHRPGVDPQPAGSDVVPELTPEAGDVLITKRTVGAFYGTPLDEQLRARGIATLVLGGIATNFGVESTLRAAADHGYDVVAVSDAMTGLDSEAHELAVAKIFPRFGTVLTTEQVALS